MANSGYKFPILNANTTVSSTVVDFDDMFVSKELFLDAGLYGWGFNTPGSIGDGTGNNLPKSSPVQVGTLTNWKQVSFNSNQNAGSSAAVKTDGTLWTWGANHSGQLGNNTRTYYSSPIQVGALTNWNQVSVGGNFCAAIGTNGALWTWGNNTTGQLGNGNTTYYSSPIQVGALTNWKQVSASSASTTNCCVGAIKTDGTLWTWGINVVGQLGINSAQNYYSSPVQVGTLTNWKQVSATLNLMAAIKTDGTLWTWGHNTTGGLGNSNTTYYSSPIQVGALTNWKQVVASIQGTTGNPFVLAIKTDGTLWSWGLNSQGQLGIGNTAYYSSPVQVGTLTNWKQVSGGATVLAISSPDLP